MLLTLTLTLGAVYLLPTLIGVIRNVDRLSLISPVNLIRGPTGIAWLAAPLLAFGPRRRQATPRAWNSGG